MTTFSGGARLIDLIGENNQDSSAKAPAARDPGAPFRSSDPVGPTSAANGPIFSSDNPPRSFNDLFPQASPSGMKSPSTPQPGAPQPSLEIAPAASSAPPTLDYRAIAEGIRREAPEFLSISLPPQVLEALTNSGALFQDALNVLRAENERLKEEVETLREEILGLKWEDKPEESASSQDD